MSSSESAPSTITFTIRRPERLLGWAWIGLGTLLVICFFLPNYAIGSLDIHGPKLLDMLLRRDGNPGRMFDEAGFFMMVAVPLVYAMLALVILGFGLQCLTRSEGKYAVLIAILGLFGLIFTISGAIVIADSGSDIILLSKLLPRPKVGFWIALVAQGLVFVLSVAYLIMKGRKSAPLVES